MADDTQKFNEDFFKELGLTDLSSEQKQKISDQLTELIQDQLSLVLAERLSDEQLEHFNVLADEQGDDKAAAYVEEVLPEFPQIMQDTTVQVVQSFVDDMNMLLDYQDKEASAPKPGQ